MGIAYGDVLDHISFVLANGKPIDSRNRTTEIEMDTTFKINWKREAFLASLAKEKSPGIATGPLTDRVELLETAVGQILTAQERQIAMAGMAVGKAVALKMNDTRRLMSLDTQLNSVRGEHGAAGVKILAAIKTLEFKDPVIYNEFKPAIEKAIGEGDYKPLGDAIGSNLTKTANELGRQSGQTSQVQVFMEAHLVGHDGRSTRIHLDRYDSLKAGSPIPFARFQTVADPRTQRDLQLAQGVANLSNQFMTGSFQSQVRDTLHDMGDGLHELVAGMNFDGITQNLTTLLDNLSKAPADGKPLHAEAKGLIETINMLTNVPTLQAADNAGKLLEIGTLLDTSSRRMLRDVTDLPSRFRSLAANMIAYNATHPGVVNTASAQNFTDFAGVFANNITYFSQISSQFREVAKAIDIGAGVALQARDLVPRAAEGDQDLDTTLDMRSVGPRYPGDRVIVDISVVSDDPQTKERKVLMQGRKEFKLEAYGLYMETRGALLMVQPQGTIDRNVSYQPTLGLGYHWKYGMKNNDFWNHGLSPGLGFSIALLDFSDKQPVEIGLALSATFFRDMFWVGFGRNFQANANYFYIGLNLSEVGGLLRRR